jgi:hypothetical protein
MVRYLTSFLQADVLGIIGMHPRHVKKKEKNGIGFPCSLIGALGHHRKVDLLPPCGSLGVEADKNEYGTFPGFP